MAQSRGVPWSVVLSVVVVLAGLVLAGFLPDQELGWFRGRPLGVVLVVLGVLDLLDEWRKRSPRDDG